jgi:hypothetical protein
MLASFSPLKSYVEFLRQLPSRCVSDIQKHALSSLRFGVHHGPSALLQQIELERKNLETECEAAKAQIPVLFRELIGCRALFYGLNWYLDSRNRARQTVTSWIEGAQEYVTYMNKAVSEGLLSRDTRHLAHIAFDPVRDSIINYRLTDQEKALGAYCALVACAYSRPKAAFRTEVDDWLEILEPTILKGYKREIRPQIRDQNPGLDGAELTEKVNAEATKRTKRHLKEIRRALQLDD